MKLRLAAARQQLRQLPITSFSETDNVGEIIDILRELEMGQFRRAAILCDEMGRDDRIAAVLETRTAALKATQVDVRQANDSPLAKKLSEALGGVDDSPGEWDRIFPQSLIGDLTRWGNLLGMGVAEKIWHTTAKRWTPRLKVWHPQFVRWDWSTMTYKILTATGEYDLPSIDEDPTGDDKWFIWCPNGYNEAYKRGMIRSLAKLYVMRGWDYRDWARWNETKGMGITKAIVPADSKEEDDDAFFEDVANRGAEPTILVRQGEDGNKYDVEQVADGGGGEGYKSFQAFKQAVDVDIAVLINGQNLTTESPAGGSSSKSLGEVQKQVSLDRLVADAGIAVAIRDQVLVPMTRFNVSRTDPGAPPPNEEGEVDPGELAPRPVYMTEPPKDQAQLATAMKTTGEAVSALKLAGIEVDEAAVAEEAGIPLKTPEQIAAEKAVQEEEQQARAAEQAAVGTPPGAPAGTPPAPGAPAGARPVAPPSKAALRAAHPNNPRRMFAGMPVVIEHAAGTTRVWRDGNDGSQVIGATKMLNDYGYLEGVQGSDGEELDVYLGPDEAAPDVHVVHQWATPDYKRHDEDKTMLGFPDAGAAKAAYLAHRNDGDRAFEGMSTIPLERFKAKLQRRTGTGKIRASAAPDALGGIRAMLAAGQLHAQKLSAPKRKRYTDQLTDRAKQLAARSLAADVAALRIEIGDAKDLPSLLKRLVTVYKGLDPKDLARVIEKTRLMAQLAGAASVHKEARG